MRERRKGCSKKGGVSIGGAAGSARRIGGNLSKEKLGGGRIGEGTGRVFSEQT